MKYLSAKIGGAPYVIRFEKKMQKIKRWFSNLLQTFLLICAITGARPLFAVTINQLVDPHGIESVVISPDGQHLAAIASTGENHGVIVIDVDTMNSKLVKQGEWTNSIDILYSKEPRNVFWVGNDLLAIDYGVYSETVDLNGKFVADIGDTLIRKINPDDPNSSLLLVRNDFRRVDLSVADARTGKIKEISLPGSGIAENVVFDEKGQARAATIYNSKTWEDITVVENWYRPSSDQAWVKLAEFKLTEDYWKPIAISKKENTLVIASSVGRDTTAIFSYDTAKREIGELMASHPTEDIIDFGGFDGEAFKWINTGGMISQRYWFDSAWNKIQRAVDSALPGCINEISGDPQNRVLIHSRSDVDPGRWFVLNVKTMKMTQVAEAKSQIDPKTMHHMEAVSYKARDGMTIPAYLTNPDAKKQGQPAVIVVHGGPTVRDEWDWNPEVQLLADRGYVVFQPQFRGSSGFGIKFQEAGYHQWGRLMQDDIADGVDYLVKRGIVDPKRVCIYGASYGGYAALWGLVKTPDLYKCGISFAGVSDLSYMFRDSSDRMHNELVRELQRMRIGNLGTDKAEFDTVSPLLHADQIKSPLLLMHGARDVRVPISHSLKMKEAMDKNKKFYEWVEFPREGHGFTYVADEFKFYATVLKFLDEYNPADVDAEAKGHKEIETLDIKAEKMRNVVTY